MPSFTCFWVEKSGDDWVRPDTGERHATPTLFPVGAVYADDGRASPEYLALCKTYPDGMRLVVITPDGPWVIDGPKYNPVPGYEFCPWTRTGDPRKPETLDVNPSINFPGRYHGHLRHGKLIDA